MWNEGFHVVPGLANVEERFGFNSNLFLLSSVFGFRQMFGEFIFAINALCLVYLFFYIFRQAKRESVQYILLFLLVIIAMFTAYKTHIGSSSTDLLPNLLIVYILFVLLTDSKNIKKKSILFWLIPVFCITLKISTVFICLLTLYLLVMFVKDKSYRTVSFICVVSLLIVLPWLARNVIISGYLIHPYPAIDLFTFDWKLPKEYSIRSNEYIRAFAISYEVMFNPVDHVMNWSLKGKIERWLYERPLHDILIALGGLISPLLMAVIYFFRKKQLKENPVLIITWVILFMGFVFWLVMAPAVRFGFGFLIMSFCIPVFLFFKDREFSLRFIPLNLILLLTIAYFGVLSVRYFLVVKESYVPYAEILYRPQNIETRLKKHPVETKVIYIDGIPVVRPMDGGCYDFPLPCTYDEYIELRGTTLQDGFRKKERPD